MDRDSILERRALRLKAELTEGSRPKPSFLSTIYPAMDHGGIPQVVKTPSSIPSTNDADAEEREPGAKEKGEKQVDEPGPSKTTSSSLLVSPGQSALVPEAHKRAAFELGYFGENRSKEFVKRCVELITGVKKLEQTGADPAVVETHGCSCADPANCECADAGDKGSSRGDDSSKLSAVAKKFGKAKPSYG